MINLRRFTKLTLAALMAMAVLSGCSVTRNLSLLPVSVRQAAEASAWELKGKLLLRSGDDKLSANLYWFRQANQQELRLTNMLGTTVLLLTENEHGAMLEVDGEIYRDQDAQKLLNRVSGIPLPLAMLPLWITGQSGPGDRVVFGVDGLPKLFRSNDGAWQVRIASWQLQSGATIPRALELVHGQASIKLQTHQWQALAAAKGVL